MNDLWITIALGVVKFIAFTYDIITYLPYYLIEQPNKKLQVSRRLKTLLYCWDYNDVLAPSGRLLAGVPQEHLDYKRVTTYMCNISTAFGLTGKFVWQTLGADCFATPMHEFSCPFNRWNISEPGRFTVAVLAGRCYSCIVKLMPDPDGGEASKSPIYSAISSGLFKLMKVKYATRGADFRVLFWGKNADVNNWNITLLIEKLWPCHCIHLLSFLLFQGR